MVSLAKDGPIYSVEWSPNSSEFTVVYGFMPAKVLLHFCSTLLTFPINYLFNFRQQSTTPRLKQFLILELDLRMPFTTALTETCLC
jgi:uncharacterized protein with WD repeat